MGVGEGWSGMGGGGRCRWKREVGKKRGEEGERGGKEVEKVYLEVVERGYGRWGRGGSGRRYGVGRGRFGNKR